MVRALPRVGALAAAALALLGAGYLAGLGYAAATGAFVFPPPTWLQTLGAVVTLASAPLLVALFAALHLGAPRRRRVLSLTALVLAGAFAFSVSANRFAQLSVVRRNDAAGMDAAGWFLPYADTSVMFAFEILGWGWLLGLAMLALAFVFARPTRLDRALRVTALTYALFSIASAVAFLAGSALVALGFVAWGPVLVVFAALLVARFRGSTSRPAVHPRAAQGGTA